MMSKVLKAAWASYWKALDPDDSVQGFSVENVEAAIHQDMVGLSQRDQAEHLAELTAELFQERADKDAEETLTNEAYRDWQGDR